MGRGWRPGRAIPSIPAVYKRDRVVADGEDNFSSLSDALAAATDSVVVGPGTFEESVTVTTDGLTIMGSGRGTVIDGDDDHAIDINADDVTVTDLSVQTTAGAGNAADGIFVTGGDRPRFINLWVLDSDRYGLRNPNGDFPFYQQIFVAGSDGHGVFDSPVEGGLMQGIYTSTGVDDRGIQIAGDRTVASGLRTQVAGSTGIVILGAQAVSIGFSIARLSGGSGFYTNSDDTTFLGCVSESNTNNGYSSDGVDTKFLGNYENGSGALAVDLSGATNPRGMLNTFTVPGDYHVVTSGTVVLANGSAVVSTGFTATGANFDVRLDPSGGGANAADVKVSARAFWDNTAGEYKIEILEDGTAVGNPTIGYQIIRT